MKYALRIGFREFAEHVKTKGFVIGIVLFPVLLFAGFRVPALLEKISKTTRAFAVIDPSGELTAIVDEAIERDWQESDDKARLAWLEKRKADPETPDYEPQKRFFQRVEIPAEAAAATPAETIANLKPWLLGDKKVKVGEDEKELFALIVMPKIQGQLKKGVEYWSTNLTDDGLSKLVSRALEDHLRRKEYTAKGIAQAEVERIARIEVRFDDKDPRKAAGEEDVGLAEKARQWAPIGFVYLMFVAMMTVAQMLLSSTVEEKASRIFEVLLSSVTPGELMLGKLMGVAAVGFVMLAAWFVSLFAILRFGAGSLSEVAGPLLGLVFTPSVLIPMAVYFLLGFLLYASLLLALGSLCNTIKEAQNFMSPVMLVLMVPLLAMIPVARDPNGVLAQVLSWIPPFTPFVMMNRIAGDPAGWEIAGTIVLLVASVAGMLWLAGRVFRNGVLRTGAPPKIVELLRMLRR
ncbi:MAG: ABC transporter permease [Planctomycetota bacterium]|nr:ABC transporter permease [Planctomycetota bacterium]